VGLRPTTRLQPPLNDLFDKNSLNSPSFNGLVDTFFSNLPSYSVYFSS